MSNPGEPVDTDFYNYSINEFIGDGERLTWEINFAGGYISQSHVKAVVTDLDGNKSERTLTWQGPSTVLIDPAVPYNHRLRIYRDTPKDNPIADFQDGAVVSEKNLDDNAKQAVFVAAEALDRGEGALGEFSTRAIVVPVGEIAPVMPKRSQMLGRLVAFDVFGNLVGVPPIDGVQVPLDSSMVHHDGASLDAALRGIVDEMFLTAEEIAGQATAITELGEQVIEQATSTEAMDGRLIQLRNEHDTLAGIVDAIAEIGDGAGIEAVIQAEASARIEGDTALAAKIALIGAANDDNSAFIIDLDNVKVSDDESLAERFMWLDVEDADNLALIQAETTARVNALAAEATARQTLGTTLNNNIASAVLTETNARVAALQAEASARTTLAATLRSEFQGSDQTLTTAINNEQTARINGDAAEAVARQQLAATLRSETDTKVAAAVQSEQTARINGDAAEAQARTTLGTVLGNQITAQVQNEATARVNGDGALAQVISLIGATYDGGTSFLLDGSKCLVTPGLSVATRFSQISASITQETTDRTNAISNVNATISQETQARVDAVSAVAQSLTSLSGTVGTQVGRVDELVNVTNIHGSRLTAFWQVTAIAGNGRAQMRIFADANGGGGVDITGDVSIHGSLTVDGTITGNKVAYQTLPTTVLVPNAVSKMNFVNTGFFYLYNFGEVECASLVVNKDEGDSVLDISATGAFRIQDNAWQINRIYVDGSQAWYNVTNTNGDNTAEFVETYALIMSGLGAGSHTITFTVELRNGASATSYVSQTFLKVEEKKR